MAAIVVGDKVCGKPPMHALEADLGHRIIETILSTPRADGGRLERECEEVNARIRKAKANGTY